MKIISQDYLPVRTFILIGMVLLTTTQTYAQNINTRLSFTLKNATLKEFVKLIENSTGYSFIYGEEVGIRHKITLKAKEMPLHEVLDTVFKDELISYQFSGRYILLKEKKGQKPVSRKFTISGYVTDGTSSETLIAVTSLRVINIREPPPILTAFTVSHCLKEKPNCVSPIWAMLRKHANSLFPKILC